MKMRFVGIQVILIIFCIAKASLSVALVFFVEGFHAYAHLRFLYK